MTISPPPVHHVKHDEDYEMHISKQHTSKYDHDGRDKNYHGKCSEHCSYEAYETRKMI